MKTITSSTRKQAGSMVLEALIAILIFSMGILAIVGLQAASIRQAADAKYRTDASLVANQLIGQMWADRLSPTFGASYATGGSKFTQWASNEVQANLPGVAANMPTVTVTANTTVGATGNTSTTSLVTIRVSWQAPNDNVAHRFDAVVQINNCPNGVPAQCNP